MRILIIEDNQKIRDFLKTALESECFAVDVAEEGKKGSFMARTNDYDLIILDNILPEKSGLEVCKEVRESGKTNPIIMLSVQSETTTKIDLLNAGADDYLTKPFSFEELLARIRALLRRPKNANGGILKTGEIILDTNKHTLNFKGKDIYLTRKEFALIEYLIKYKGTVLSRGMIMEHVWNIDADPFSNTIESHVLSLRNKLQDKKRKLIQTVPGVGYKLNTE